MKEETPPSSEQDIFRKIAGIEGLSPKERELIELSSAYREFFAFKDVAETMKTVIDKHERAEDFKIELEQLLKSVEQGSEILERSLGNQEEYNLVDKRWMRDTASLREAFERGRLVMELDVRLDADGEFWVSHAVGARASALPPYIHEMSTEEMTEKSTRFLVSEGLDILSEYKDNGHRFILELKTLGDDPEKFPEVVARLKALIEEKGVEDAVAVASLSPGILMAVHESIPDMPLILNGGIVPGISYSEKGENLINALVPRDKKWRAVGVGPLEIVISAGDTSPRREDGEGKQTGYALARLPDDIVEVFQEQHKEGNKLGGLASLSAVSILASVLRTFGANEKADAMLQYYSDVVDELGLGKMATTWGQGLSTIPGFRHLAPEVQAKTFLKIFGEDTVIYTKSPETWAHTLNPNKREFLAIDEE